MKAYHFILFTWNLTTNFEELKKTNKKPPKNKHNKKQQYFGLGLL